jgi:hypothetical protein
MDWIYAEMKYRELQFEMDKAFDKWSENPANNENYIAYDVAKQKFMAYCVDTLAELMEENKDVLERLKNGTC